MIGQSAASPQEWLAEIVDKVGDAKKAAASNVERLEHGGQALSQVANEDIPPADAEQRLAKARKVLENAVGNSREPKRLAGA